MPTYEYVCEKCGHHFDQFQSMSADALKICPKELCSQKRWGKGKVSRAIGAGAGLIFKGSGFYITDYRSEKYKQSEKDAKATPTPPSTTPAAASTPAASSSSPSGTDKKPAAKAESKKTKS
jgi:putative FmdB family regulatory protein